MFLAFLIKQTHSHSHRSIDPTLAVKSDLLRIHAGDGDDDDKWIDDIKFFLEAKI